MKAYFLRRKKLGKTSTESISNLMKNDTAVYRNDAALPNNDALVIRWGCTSTVPQKKVLNRASAIHLSSNKAEFRMLCQASNVPCPTSTMSKEKAYEWVDLAFKVVVRPSHHAQGKHLYLCSTRSQLDKAFTQCGEGAYAALFIDKVAEYRVFVAQGRAVWVAKKTPGNPEDVAWNVAQGGKFENVRWGDWPLSVVDTAIKAHNLCGLDFSGIDIMVDKYDNTHVLEANSAPSQTSEYRQSCVAKVLDYILDEGSKEPIALGATGKYLKYIHPALDSKAIVG